MSSADVSDETRAHRADEGAAIESAPRLELTPAQTKRFHTLYRDHFDFVFRNLRRLGVGSGDVDDALQDVFLVVLRRIDDYRDATYGKAWLFAIALRVAGSYRRSQRRKDALKQRAETHAEPPVVRIEPSPFERAARAEAGQFLHEFLASMEETKRSVFVLAELEQMTAPEIAQALGVNLNTVYSRIRTARIELARAISQLTGEQGDEG